VARAAVSGSDARTAAVIASWIENRSGPGSAPVTAGAIITDRIT
jgi:hypothetical protein